MLSEFLEKAVEIAANSVGAKWRDSVDGGTYALVHESAKIVSRPGPQRPEAQHAFRTLQSFVDWANSDHNEGGEAYVGDDKVVYVGNPNALRSCVVTAELLYTREWAEVRDMLTGDGPISPEHLHRFARRLGPALGTAYDDLIAALRAVRVTKREDIAVEINARGETILQGSSKGAQLESPLPNSIRASVPVYRNTIDEVWVSVEFDLRAEEKDGRVSFYLDGDLLAPQMDATRQVHEQVAEALKIDPVAVYTGEYFTERHPATEFETP